MTIWMRGAAPPWLNVSRETLAQLVTVLELLEKWQSAINLVSTASLPFAWERHVLDSAQLYAFCPTGATQWVDLGSGAGFPGLVVAVLAATVQPNLSVTLVESDKRKAAFLAQAAQQLDLRISLRTERAEELTPMQADVVSARALAPLVDLCPLVARHGKPGCLAILPKGAQAESEVATARRIWHFDATLHPSHTDPDARIVLMKNLHHA